MNKKVIKFLKENGYEILGERSMNKFLPLDYEIYRREIGDLSLDRNKPMRLIMNGYDIDTKKHIYFGLEEDDGPYFCTILYPLECDFGNSFYVCSSSFKKILLESYWKAIQRATHFFKSSFYGDYEQYMVIVTELQTLIEKLMIDLDK